MFPSPFCHEAFFLFWSFLLLKLNAFDLFCSIIKPHTFSYFNLISKITQLLNFHHGGDHPRWIILLTLINYISARNNSINIIQSTREKYFIINCILGLFPNKILCWILMTRLQFWKVNKHFKKWNRCKGKHMIFIFFNHDIWWVHNKSLLDIMVKYLK